MARRNAFKEQETDFLSMLDEESTEDDLTKTIARELDKEQELSNEIMTASPDKFIPFDDKKLRLELHHGEERERLKESIKINGIFTPVICARKDDKLMILSGHNRVDVAKELNIEVPYILKNDLSSEEMSLICIDDNLIHRQRSDYKPMQLAYLIKVKMDAEKHQGVTYGNGFHKSTGEKVGENYGLTGRMIRTYQKLNDLIEEAKELVDAKKISIRLAYELAFLDADSQKILIYYINDFKFNEKNVKELRNKLKEKNIQNYEDKKTFIESQLLQYKVGGNRNHKLDYRRLRKIIPDTIKDENIEEYIIDAIKYYNGIKNQLEETVSTS